MKNAQGNSKGVIPFLNSYTDKIFAAYPARTPAQIWFKFVPMNHFAFKPSDNTDKISLETTINVYPNPFYDRINISYLSNEAILHSKIYDLSGRLIWDYKGKIESTNTDLNDLNFKPGIYLLKVKDVITGDTFTFKLINTQP